MARLENGLASAATPSRRFWLVWLPTFVGFPLGGLAASLAVGPVDGVAAALAGGALAGAVLGLAQWLALRALYRVGPGWIVATGLGLALGLAAGVGLVGSGTGTLELLARGAASGLGVGAAQALAARGLPLGGRWALASALLWALAWPVTALVIGSDIGRGYAVFGASGALLVTVAGGALLHRTMHRTMQGGGRGR